ncbi:dTMP kinase [Salinibaculum rarum]|uniref:dTMP kinase n=1 Tax=Salinibaculum rarum TaxID=3058903 RepID=UPI00265F0D81|nr:dTMP kinase [Salinibaculum sp. KK48]
MTDTTTSGTLITLEGIDGSGKTTAWETLKEELPNKIDDTEIIFTREPTQDTFYGDAVYQSLHQDDADALAELFLYIADHAAHLNNTILPALNDGKVVISDRYIDSRCAYQAATLSNYTGLSVDNILTWIQNLHQPWSRIPDLTIYLSVPPETAVERSAKANKFERLNHLETVAANYEITMEQQRNRFASIDATQTKSTVQSTIIETTTEFLTRQH